jgi:4-amino-4-deoxy-L-arabinose transferase-like glycosyltransferase
LGTGDASAIRTVRSRVEYAGPWIALVLAALFLAQGLLGNRDKSLTWDEPVYITGGHAALLRGELESFTVTWGAPPLMQLLEAALVLPLGLSFPQAEDPAWANPVSLAREFVFGSGHDLQRVAFRARLPVLLIGAGLIAGIYFRTRQLYGDWPALTAVTLAAFSPNLLAHAKLATTDLGCAAAMFAAVWAFHRAVETGTVRDQLLSGVLVGLALLTKFTALLLVPILLALGAIAFWPDRRSRPLAPLLRGAAIVPLVALFVVGAGYLFSFDLSFYWRGLRGIYATHQQNYTFYLLGRVSDEPWWYYHFVVLFLKVPLATLAVLGIAAATAVSLRNRYQAALFCIVPAAAVLVASCFDQRNIGLRRVLPALPFLFVFAGCAAAQSGVRRKVAVALLVAWAAVAGLWIFPHHLAYFNVLAGGPERGPFLLDDSNIDWGQDLPSLARWQEGRPQNERVRLLYFGTADPSAYGVRSEPFASRDMLAPRPGVYAVSAHMLVWMRKIQRERADVVDWLARYRPIARAGYSIYIYEFPQTARE